MLIDLKSKFKRKKIQNTNREESLNLKIKLKTKYWSDINLLIQLIIKWDRILI